MATVKGERVRNYFLKPNVWKLPVKLLESDFSVTTPNFKSFLMLDFGSISS